MRLVPYGDRALLVELDSTAQVVAWADAVRTAVDVGALTGVLEVVPAEQTVLVVADESTDVGALSAALQQVRSGGAAEGESADTVVIPVRYDGPDLADVARLCGLSAADVVAAHTRTTWRVAFGGFAPGFAYLVGGDPRLVVPRRASPRTAVPAGAVGLAGEYSGVYPRSSPGGWQLIGTTHLRLWDPDAEPPALLRPGACVRFEEAG